MPRRTTRESETEEYARAGTDATETVELEEGALDGFPHNMEPYLRKLGLPTKGLKKDLAARLLEAIASGSAGAQRRATAKGRRRCRT